MSSADRISVPDGAPSGATLFLDDDTQFRVTAWNAAPGVTLAVTSLVWHPDRGVQRSRDVFTPTSDRLATTVVVRTAGGWLLGFQVVPIITPKRGQCFVRVELIKGLDPVNAPSLATVVQGLVGGKGALSYPGSPIESSIEGRGTMRIVAGTDRAAGVELEESPPPNARWRVLSLAYTLVTSAAVANRTPVLTVDFIGTAVYEVATNIAQTASQTAKYRAAPGVPFLTIGTLAYLLPLPQDLILTEEMRIRTVTGALDAGDNYGQPLLIVEEWINE